MIRRIVGAPSPSNQIQLGQDYILGLFSCLRLFWCPYTKLQPTFCQSGLADNLVGPDDAYSRSSWEDRLENSEPFHDSIELHGRDVLVFLSYLVLLATFSYDQLQFSLFGDELGYANTSQLLSLNVGLAWYNT